MSIRAYESIESAVAGCFGAGVKIVRTSYVGGGDINDASCLELSNGERVFVKSNTLDNSAFFDAEEAGLDAIVSTNAVKTPKLLAKGRDTIKRRSFLMMEMIESARPVSDRWEVFGRELAAMHKADTTEFVDSGRFGFVSDNFIGASEQINSGRDTWLSFFRECRLEPQFKRASRYFADDFLPKVVRFLDNLDSILIEPEYPSLLHGDMWSGNIITGSDGKMMLIDPAVYVGHAEADLAMTELFGRLPEAFYRAYREAAQIRDGYEQRRDVYNLYHLLNHLNLFGRSYLEPVVGIVRKHL